MSARVALLFMVLIPTVAHAQLPLPDSAVTWVNTWYAVEPWPPPALFTLVDADSYCASGEDTLINSLTYTQLAYCTGDYKGAFRNDTGAVWYVPADSVQEYLLYDFGAQVGDSLEVYWEMALSGQGTVSTVVVNSVFPDNQLEDRNVVYLNEGGQWIEGIGAAWGLFSEPYANVSNYLLRLECMSLEDSIHYPFPTTGICDISMGVGEERMMEVSAFPNPATDRITITLPNADAHWLLLYDATGRVVRDARVTGIRTEIDLAGVHAGTYWLRMVGDDTVGCVPVVKQ